MQWSSGRRGYYLAGYTERFSVWLWLSDVWHDVCWVFRNR